MSCRGWCFTLHDYTAEEEQLIQALDAQYLVYGHETCPETGRLHLQGYIYFKGRGKRFGGVKSLLPDRVHLEQAKGSPQENHAYCTKEDKEGFISQGQMPKQGKRNDIEVVREAIAGGAGMRQVVQIATSYQAMKAAEMILKYSNLEEKNRDLSVFWFWGPTGSGKSYTARQEAGPGVDVFTAHATATWWDGYDNHNVILIDDYRANFCPFNELLRLLDIYPKQLPIKGGFRQLKATKIYITTPKNPHDTWASRTPEDLQQLLRRITEVREFAPRHVDLPPVNDYAALPVPNGDYDYQE